MATKRVNLIEVADLASLPAGIQAVAALDYSGAAPPADMQVVGATWGSLGTVWPGRHVQLGAVRYAAGATTPPWLKRVAAVVPDPVKDARLSGLLTGLVSYFPLTEASGAAVDVVAGLSLAQLNDPVAAAGIIGNGRAFVAASTQLLQSAANPSAPRFTSDFSVACWVKFTSVGNQDVLGKWGGSDKGFGITLNAQRLRWQVGRADSIASSVAVTDANFGLIQADTWYFVYCWCVSGSQIGLRINDAAETAAAFAYAPNPSAAKFTIGYGVIIGQLDGVVDETGGWERLLASDEVTTLYNGGLGQTYPFDGALAGPGLSVSAPQAYQVVQRSGVTGDIAISGAVAGGPYTVEASFNGGDYADVATVTNGAYSGTLAGQAQGQGSLTVRLKEAPTIYRIVPLVGIGDVFVIAGQSNPSGRGTNNQTYSHATLKAGLLGNDYRWKHLADPTDAWAGQVDTVSSDSGNATGSLWPLLATSHMAAQSVPVAFIPCAMGGSSITAWQPGANHQDRATLYGSMAYRALQAGGVKAVLWWQGETDALAAMSEATYNAYLDTLANAIFADLGCQLVPCKIQNSTGIADGAEAAINAAIGAAWVDNANVAAGPDLSDMASDDDYHLTSDANLATAATRWWNALAAVFYA